ncbi:MAG TPA: hypothetical protein VFF70_08930 [Anaerolineae bacterium]|nr:hypothetical protein [Anaerolineae bacterium]
MRFRSGMLMTIGLMIFLAGCGSRPLLAKASFTPDTVSPNGDNQADATLVHYELSSDANLSIYFESRAGQKYFFRQDQFRSTGAYDVLFGGVIDGQLLPDGQYQWIVEAKDQAGRSQSLAGTLTITGGDSTAPQFTTFTVLPKVFTPNQDGISDRTTINVGLNKPATLLVSVQNILCNGSTAPPADRPDLECTPYLLAEKQGRRAVGDSGVHEFDYDAGVDLGANPPPDGTYIITARAEDSVGQVTVTSDTLTIQAGGIPQAEIADGTVNFSADSLLVGQTLYFTLTVDNYGPVAIRTSGPNPGYIYEMDQNYNVPGFAEESGAWRVGIDFDTSERNYPFRWSVGGPNDLIVQEVNGVKYYYLPPGKQAIIAGGIHLTEKPPRDPLYFWAGLIHEDVEIRSINNRVDPHFITIDKP